MKSRRCCKCANRSKRRGKPSAAKRTQKLAFEEKCYRMRGKTCSRQKWFSEDWHAGCQAICKGVEGAAVNIRHPSASHRANTLWMLGEAEEKGDAFNKVEVETFRIIKKITQEKINQETEYIKIPQNQYTDKSCCCDCCDTATISPGANGAQKEADRETPIQVGPPIQ